MKKSQLYGDTTLYRDTPLFQWCIDNKPLEGSDAKFYSYSFIFSEVMGIGEEFKSDAESIIDSELLAIDEPLYLEQCVAIQPEAIQNGERGIRILNVE